MNTQSFWRTTTLILAVTLLVFCVGVAGLAVGMTLGVGRVSDLPMVGSVSAAPATPLLADRTPVSNDVPMQMDEEEQLLQAIYREVSSSVVYIRVVQASGYDAPVQPYDQNIPQQPQQGEGSGFVLDQSGHIVTNYHVAQNASKLEVTFVDGTTVRARYIGGDSDADLAVLQVDLPAAQLKPVRLGDSDSVFVGQRAIAIGNPFGQEWTMTTGIVSAIGRTMPSGTSQYSIPEMIQTDAAINPGNSGGPLLNAQAEVIGVNTMILSRSNSSAGVGFAVPSNVVKLIVPDLIEKGRFVYAWLGVQGSELSLDLIEAMGLPAGTRGVLVVGVVPGSPAAVSGLRGSDRAVMVDGAQLQVGGDVITAIDGRPIGSMGEVIVYLVKHKRPGDQITLTVLRSGQQQILTVTLAERPRTT
jgi:serine protease Do